MSEERTIHLMSGVEHCDDGTFQAHIKMSEYVQYINNWQKTAPYGAATKEQVQELIDRVIEAMEYTGYGECRILAPEVMHRKCVYLTASGENPYYEFYTAGWSDCEWIIEALMANKKAGILIEMHRINAIFIIRSRI